MSLFFLLKENGEEEAEHDFLSQEFLMHEDSRSEEGTDTEEIPSSDKTINYSKTMDEKTVASSQEQNVTLRQRTNRHIFKVPVRNSVFTLSSQILVPFL